MLSLVHTYLLDQPSDVKCPEYNLFHDKININVPSTPVSLSISTLKKDSFTLLNASKQHRELLSRTYTSAYNAMTDYLTPIQGLIPAEKLTSSPMKLADPDSLFTVLAWLCQEHRKKRLACVTYPISGDLWASVILINHLLRIMY